METGRLIYSLKRHSDAITDIVLSSDDRTLVSTSLDKTIRLWDLYQGQLIHTEEAQLNLVVAASPNNRYIVTGNERGNIKLWRVIF